MDKGGFEMSRLLVLIAVFSATSLSLGSELTLPTDDVEIDELVIRRKVKKTTVPSALPGSVGPIVSVQPEEPPPEPPAAEAAEPRRLVRYFCKAWKDEDWERLWWSMTPQYRKRVSLKKFTKLFTEDAESNGGLKDENIVDEMKTNAGVGVKVELSFKFRNAKHRIVKAEVQRIPGGQYRVVESPIIPMDLNDL